MRGSFRMPGGNAASHRRDCRGDGQLARPISIRAVGLDEASQKMHQLLFSSLMRIDDTLRVVPDLAVRLDWPDPLTYIAELPPRRAVSRRP